ncbi:MAG: GIY-YIG nuclease family protein [Ignavibacteria bacterium]|nr:GIY-YIG nuclease family protein [Ignavibacteria bacterium]
MGEKFYVYILHSLKTNRYYVGQTNDLERRLMYHNSGYDFLMR